VFGWVAKVDRMFEKEEGDAKMRDLYMYI